jgi:hypothetical protein
MADMQARLMERVGEGILQAAQAEERRLDEQLAGMDNIDEDNFEALRQKRKIDLQKKLRQEQDWRQLGHGRSVKMEKIEFVSKILNFY